MKKQNGSALVAVMLVLGGLVAVVALAVMVFISANNTANAFEQRIKAEHTNNKNVLSQYHQKILEAAQAPEMMRDDLIKVATETMEGRYGAEGSKAIFQMITEQNPNMDASLYTKLQQIVESSRDEFKTSQTRLIDTKRAYTTALGNMPKGFIMKFMGFPRINLDDFNIVTTQGVEQSFRDGKEAAPIKLRPAP